MSKKKKVSATKPAIKKVLKKATKKVAKPVKKKPAPKKSTSKPLKKKKIEKKVPKPVAKKPAKKIVKKPAKKLVKKTKLPKKAVKKAAKPLKKVAKASAKKTLKAKPLKKVKIAKAKPAKKVAPPKKVAQPAPKKESKKEIASTPKEKLKKQDEQPTKKQIAELRAQEVLAITNTIPVKKKSEISPSKIASISHSITNPVKRPDSYAVKPEKEPNGKFELEFVVHSSAEMLYEFLSTPSGLSEWFCDDLNIRNGIYTFIWDDQLSQARLLKTVELQVVRFQWVDKTDGSYFEFRIQRDDLTNDISLIITDFAETVSERESSKLLWNSQVEKLMHVLGSIF